MNKKKFSLKSLNFILSFQVIATPLFISCNYKHSNKIDEKKISPKSVPISVKVQFIEN